MYKVSITKSVYNNEIKIKLFDNCEFEIEIDKITSVVAPFKSGKTTLLKILSGIEQADVKIESISNNFFITSEPMSLPWMTLRQSLQFANQKIDDVNIKELSKVVGLEGYEDHLPNNKSLGFRFRIVLAAALSKKSKTILLDEPFIKMDQQTKYEIYQLIIELNKKHGIGFVIGTSALNEAILISNNVILLKNSPHRFAVNYEFENSKENIEKKLKSTFLPNSLQKILNEIKNEKNFNDFNYII